MPVYKKKSTKSYKSKSGTAKYKKAAGTKYKKSKAGYTKPKKAAGTKYKKSKAGYTKPKKAYTYSLNLKGGKITQECRPISVNHVQRCAFVKNAKKAETAVYNNMTTIYILCLTNNKYYIGKTNNPQKRILNHFQHQGSAWTKKYQPISIEKVINNADNFDEDKWTIKYMQKYGIDNVRGGSFCSIQLSKSDKETLQRMITGSSDCCYKCGQSGHYISQCPAAQQDYNSGNCYSYSGSNINTVVYTQTQNTKFPCSQCGRTFDTKKGAAYHKRFYCKKKPAGIRRSTRSISIQEIWYSMALVLRWSQVTMITLFRPNRQHSHPTLRYRPTR